MITTIEISGSAIRCARMVNGRLASLDHHAIADGVDPLDALEKAPLPRPLGRVAVVLNHSDLLIKTMVQPPCPVERLDRIVRFELQASRGDDPQPVAVSWHLVKTGGDGDMRVLTLMTKSGLIERLKTAVAAHDGKLANIVPSSLGIYHAWRRQTAAENEDCILIDVGGNYVHLALVRSGELLLIRAQGPGMSQLAKDLAETQGLPLAEARELLTKLGKGSPANLHDLIRRHVHSVATLVTNTIRFAKAQLQIDQYEPKLVYVGGAGAQVYGFCDHLKERLQSRVRLLNPFAGILSSLPSEQLDKASILPSPWTVALGTAAAENYELDGLQEAREQRAGFWRTHGALRAACVGAAALLFLAAGRQQLALNSAAATIDTLKGDGSSGLVPKAEGVAKELADLEAAFHADAQKIAFLDGERRPGRVVVELMNAIVDQQDPESCPVMVRQFRLLRQGSGIHIEVDGIAESARNKSTADVLRTFERGLVRAYEPIGSMVAIAKPASGNAQEFSYRIVIPDQPPQLTIGGGGEGFALTMIVDAACDARGAAQVAVDRVRSAEDKGTISVKAGAVSQDFTWSVRTGLASRGR